MLDTREVFFYDSGSSAPFALGFNPSDYEWRIVGRDEWSDRLIIFWHEINSQCDDADRESDSAADLGIKITLFDTRTQTAEIIFSSEEFYDIVQCSIDQEGTRLAFVCKTTQKCHIQSSDFGQQAADESLASNNVLGYMCYWTVLNSDFELNRACPLNNETSAEIAVQFLSSTQLLVFVLQEAIYLYTLPSKGDLRHIALSAPVLYEKLTGPFPWAQWDVTSGRVFYLQFRSPQRSSHSLQNWDSPSVTATDSLSDNSSALMCPFLVGLQFHPHTPFETLLNIPLETLIIQAPEIAGERCFPDKDGKRHSPLSNRMSDLTLGLQLQVFVQSFGTASICQGIVQERHGGKRSLGSSVEANTFLEVSYTVTLLHHGCTLHCKVNVHDCVNANVQLMFASTDDGILVMVPGLLTHLLDVGVDHEPSNHILTSECEFSVPDSGEFMDFLYKESSTTSTSLSQLELLITGSKQIKRIVVNITPDSLLSALKRSATGPSSASSVQIAILHHLLLHRTDFTSVQKALEHLVGDVRNPQITCFFQEFLLCGSFALSREHLEDNFIALLPPSAAKPLTTLNEVSRHGKMNTTVSYTSLLKDATSMLLSPNERHIPRRKMTDAWSQLWNHMRMRRVRANFASSTNSCRFTARPLRDRLLALGDPRSFEQQSSKSADLNQLNPKHATSPSLSLDPLTSSASEDDSASRQRSHSSNSSICQRILSIAADLGRVFGTSQLLNLNSSLSLSQCNDDEEDNLSTQLEQIVSLNLREITVHFGKSFSIDMSSRIDNAACIYVANRLHQSQLLCHFLFQSLNVNPHLQGQLSSTHPYEYLDLIPVADRKRLFALLERYLVAVEELSFPRPQGFDSFFSVLAFRCLDFNDFLRYVDYGVVQLTSEVLMCVSVDSSFYADDDMVMEIISRLPRQRALRLLKQWDRPSTKLVRILDIIEQYLHVQFASEDGNYDIESESSFSSDRVHQYPEVSRLNEDASGLMSALPISVDMAMKCFLLHLKRHEKYETSEDKSSEDFSSSFPHLSDELELVKNTMTYNIFDEMNACQR